MKQRKELESLMVEGYKATCKEEKDLNSEWERVTLEKWD
jgi:hypothetical protein